MPQKKWELEQRSATEILQHEAIRFGGKGPLSRKLGKSSGYLTAMWAMSKPFGYDVSLSMRDLLGIPCCASQDRDRPIAETMWAEQAAASRIRPPLLEPV